MAGVVDQGGDVPGYTVPLHRALSEPILLGGAPRAIAIMNGTLAGAVGLGLRLWLVGIAIWAIGHFAAVWAAKRDPLFVEVGAAEMRGALEAAVLVEDNPRRDKGCPGKEIRKAGGVAAIFAQAHHGRTQVGYRRWRRATSTKRGSRRAAHTPSA